MRTDPSWVLDTSVVARWFLEGEDQRDAALQVRSHIEAAPDAFAVPALFYSELVHVLARKSGSDESKVREALEIVVGLGIITLPLTQTMLGRLPTLACKGLGGYDATFVALALELGAKWLTADERAARVAGSKATVRLSAWKPSG